MTMLRVCAVAVLASAGLVCSSAGAATTIKFPDPGFESPVVQKGGFTYYSGGETVDNVWAVGGNGATLFNRYYAYDGVTYNPQSGNQFVDLAGPSVNVSPGSVSYTLTAVPNVDYHYSFSLGNAPSNTDGATVNVWTIINGFTPAFALPVTNSNVTEGSINWQEVTGSFDFGPGDISNAPSTTVELLFVNGTPGGGFVGLDSFSVPEPSTWAMLLMGLFGLGAVLRHARGKRLGIVASV